MEHRRPWPGSDSTEHSVYSTLSADDDTPTNGVGPTLGRQLSRSASDADYANGSGRWLPADFAPACPHCATVTSTYSLYCVFDGHNGVHAAKLAGDSVLALIEARLPLGCPPPPDHPLFEQFREGIQLAMAEAIVEMNRLFAQRGIHAGCTATIALQVGWLVTVAGLGDSRAVLDTGVETINLSADHRVATHKAERRRVEAMGAIVAPLAMWGTGPADDYASGIGPLRIWPGGLSISRAIGDFDVGDAVLPFPHVMQVMVPPTGGRLLVGSDGVWDAFDKMARANGMSRGWSTEATPSRMIQTIVRAFGGLKDDTTLIVADILPPGVTFPQVATMVKKGGGGTGSVGGSNGVGGSSGGGGGGGGLCGCFGGGGGAGLAEPDLATANGTSNPSVRSGVAADASVRSYASNGSVSVRGGRPRVEVLASVDVAGIMGLMPEPELVIPRWYTPEVGERLFRSASDAADEWRAAHEKRYARPPSTPSLPEVSKPRRGKSRKSVAFSKDTIERATVKEEREPTSGTGTTDMRRTASMHFADSTADGGADFAAKFGHYHSNEEGRPTLTAEASVRAGRVYNSEASMRAGNHYNPPDDPSVRLRGSNLEGSMHLKASAIVEEDATTTTTGSDPPGLAPVRVVKRTGASTPQAVPQSTKGSKLPNDSVREHMLKFTDDGLPSIGE